MISTSVCFTLQHPTSPRSIPVPVAHRAEAAGELKGRRDGVLRLRQVFFCVLRPLTPMASRSPGKHLLHVLPRYQRCCSRHRLQRSLRLNTTLVSVSL